MRIIFLCRHCFSECRSKIKKADQALSCFSCGKPQILHLTEASFEQNQVDCCAVCQNREFYVREDPRKLLGIAYLTFGLGFSYWTFGLTVLVGFWGFHWYFFKYPRITICYNCYAKYQECCLNPKHLEYNLELAARVEQEIRNDRRLRDFCGF